MKYFEKGDYNRVRKMCKGIDTHDAYRTIAITYFKEGNFKNAVDYYKKALKLNPNNLDSINELGCSYGCLDDHASSEIYFRKALGISSNVNTLTNLAICLSEQKKFTEAEEIYQKIYDLTKNKEILHQIQMMYLLSEDVELIMSYTNKLYDLTNDYIVYHTAANYLEKNKKDKFIAIPFYEKAIEANPNDFVSYNNLGSIAMNYRKFDEAEKYFTIADKMNPNNSTIINNFAKLEKYRGNINKSYEWFSKALNLGLKPEDVYSNLGAINFELGNYSEAYNLYVRSLSIDPNNQIARTNLGNYYLLSGDLEKGWEYYESRKYKPEYTKWGEHWNGEKNKTILVVPEQGLGDVLQFVRYIPMIKKISKKVIFLCPTPLYETLKNIKGVDHIFEHKEGKLEIPVFDYYVDLLSLPYIFKTTLDNIPNEQYIFPDKEKVKYWAERMKEYKKPKIGLVWRGNNREHDIDCHMIDNRRSLNLSQFEPFLDYNKFDFFSLQKDDVDNQIVNYPKIINYMPEMKDFSDTAAIIENLDLVISVDTSVVHITGGMNKPIWMLSRFDCCWRWLLNRNDSPWYPSMKIFRQSIPYHWDNVVEDIKNMLEDLK